MKRSRLESRRKEEEGEAKEYLEKDCRGRTEESRTRGDHITL